MAQWRVRDVMTTDVAAVRESTPYREIVELLAARGVSSVPVLDDHGRVVGVVSEADLLHKLEFSGLMAHVELLERRLRGAARSKAAARVAGDLMTSPAITIGPDVALAAVAATMDAEHIRRLPVVDDGRLVGIVSRRDLLRTYLRSDEAIREEIITEILEQWRGADVAAVVERGRVILVGHVDQLSTARILIRLCEGVAGVVAVVGDLSFAHDDT